MKKEILTFCESFFEKLFIDIDSLKIKKETDNLFLIQLKSSDWDDLIWKQGESIDSLQRVIQMCINNMFEEKVKIRLKLNEYLKTKNDRLYEFIDSKVKILLENGGEYMLPDYCPYERKKIHSYIAHIKKWIKTKSRWKWTDRRLYLMVISKNSTQNNFASKPTPQKLTIDINWDGI